MPNWVMNRLVLTGKRANELADKILSKDVETGKEYMNFNNIDRMPDTLNCVCGSCTAPAAEYYLTAINPTSTLKVRGYKKVSEDEFAHMLSKINDCYGERKLYGTNEFGVQEDDFNTLGGKSSYLKYGKTIIENRMNYGASTWYEWSREHWGVKWNASSSRVSRGTNEVEIYFETPWDGVARLMAKAGTIIPEVELTYDCSEEQTAYCEKYMKMKNGRVVDGKIYEPGSKEAVEHFMWLWGVEDEFVYDPKINNYRSRWDTSDDDDQD